MCLQWYQYPCFVICCGAISDETATPLTFTTPVVSKLGFILQALEHTRWHLRSWLWAMSPFFSLFFFTRQTHPETFTAIPFASTSYRAIRYDMKWEIWSEPVLTMAFGRLALQCKRLSLFMHISWFNLKFMNRSKMSSFHFHTIQSFVERLSLNPQCQMKDLMQKLSPFQMPTRAGGVKVKQVIFPFHWIECKFV